MRTDRLVKLVKEFIFLSLCNVVLTDVVWFEGIIHLRSSDCQVLVVIAWLPREVGLVLVVREHILDQKT